MKKVTILLLVVALTAGSLLLWRYVNANQATPEEVFNEYVSQFSEQNYQEMLKHISEGELETFDYTKQSLTDKYGAIFSGIESSSIDVLSKELLYDEDNETYEGRFKVKIHTFLGEITAFYQTSFIEEESSDGKVWKVKWNPSLIFAGMEKGDKVSAQSFLPERGAILDRNGNPLALDMDVYEIGIIPGKLGESKEAGIKILSTYFKIPEETFQKALDQKWVTDDIFVPIAAMPADFHPESIVEALPGVAFQTKRMRYYPEKESSAHLVGYVKQVTREDLEKGADHEYTSDDYIGKSGLEQVYEKQLRGKKGGIIQIKNEEGEQKSILKKVDTIDGKDINLRIDAALQSHIYEAMKQDAGAVSAIHPVTGEMLALVSYPSFDPNLMVSGMTEKQWKAFSENPKLPFLNRFSSLYAPGSTFKAITAASGLTAGTTFPEKKRDISGLQWKKDKSWGGYYVTRVKAANPVDMVDALAYSDNIYFAQEALEMGAVQFEKNASSFGFQEDFQLPIHLKKSQLSNDGIDNEVLLADSAYGQGEVLMSTVHLGTAFTPFVNDGNMVMPVLVADEKESVRKSVISSDVASAVQKALIQVVEREDGTAHNLKTAKEVLAAKTGTAELKSKKGEDGTENGFVVVFDTKSPSILLTAVVEDVKNRGGSHYVTAKVKPVLDQYFAENE
ncbi:penicillin-binding transpeptidase domain-containing protein [Bacillus sp. CECT 9360]|uniref:penicillin-binding protein PBP4(5) n=1 Tax=Bacillus sp. CECT 9360 TaxID=2845821 RepID=UPI001E2ACCB8|nr:penicillin-binding transpeptidase domain-containing protein [Bacillus sp. CECT 9360]CAH0343930.1 Beta-lactam-inducible penicillin-binding protein [Bacillus sp. CECT 9360]